MPKKTRDYLSLYFDSKKIKDYDENDFKELYGFLLNLSNLIGVIEPPEKDIMVAVIDHLKSHHSDFSKEEIYKAFSLGMAKKLDLDFKVYNRITPQFISEVINAYNKNRAKEICKYNRILEEKKYIPKTPTEKEQRKTSIELCLKQFNLYQAQLRIKETERKEIIDWGNICYNFLDKYNLLNLDDKEKKEIYNKAKKLQFKKNNNFKSLLNKSTQQGLKSISKQIALNKYFDEIIKNKTTLLQIFKNKIMNTKPQRKKL